jgi:hypothetical protein
LEGGRVDSLDASSIVSDLPNTFLDFENPLTVPFFDELRHARLVAQQCQSCGYRLWPPGPLCPQCLSNELEWTPVSARGIVWSYADYQRALGPNFAAEVPYCVGLVQLDDGPRMVGRIERDSIPRVGAAVSAVFDPDRPDLLPTWRVEGKE